MPTRVRNATLGASSRALCLRSRAAATFEALKTSRWSSPHTPRPSTAALSRPTAAWPRPTARSLLSSPTLAPSRCASLQCGQSDFGRPKPKTYADKDEETKEKLKTLAAAYRIFAAQGYDEGASGGEPMQAEQAGVAGHITLRDPKGRGFWSVWRLWMPD